MTVSNALVGRVIGRSGTKINGIQEASGAHITVSRNIPKSTERLVTIKVCAVQPSVCIEVTSSPFLSLSLPLPLSLSLSPPPSLSLPPSLPLSLPPSLSPSLPLSLPLSLSLSLSLPLTGNTALSVKSTGADHGGSQHAR